ncbi:MAG: hypothetical protein ABIQ52_14710 [Vicinamibacterales bacterium]
MAWTLSVAILTPAVGFAQAPAAHQHHPGMEMSDAPDWQLMQDGVVFGLFNHQGGPRGGDEFRVPNWWMGMATKTSGRSKLTLTSMLSLDPATVGKAGYREIFQVGESLNGKPLIDRQHPHDLFMQLAAVWRYAVNDQTGFTLAGGPAGEPALGPVAFMHRASSVENPFAPLGHHTFDSTHIAFGVVTAAIDRGPFVLEGSLFNGREPDENRWNFDFGRMDSVSARLWYTPAPQWELQVSTGRLVEPEELEEGNVQRTTASASWTRHAGRDMTAVTFGYGVNATNHGRRNAVFAEATRRVGATAAYGRAEVLQLEAEPLLAGTPPPAGADLGSPLAAFTGGAVRDVGTWRGFEGAVGAAVTLYAVPDVLKPSHGSHPVSFQVFFRLRPPAGAMGRMSNMRMSQPMAGHDMK